MYQQFGQYFQYQNLIQLSQDTMDSEQTQIKGSELLSIQDLMELCKRLYAPEDTLGGHDKIGGMITEAQGNSFENLKILTNQSLNMLLASTNRNLDVVHFSDFFKDINLPHKKQLMQQREKVLVLRALLNDVFQHEGVEKIILEGDNQGLNLLSHCLYPGSQSMKNFTNFLSSHFSYSIYYFTKQQCVFGEVFSQLKNKQIKLSYKDISQHVQKLKNHKEPPKQGNVIFFQETEMKEKGELNELEKQQKIQSQRQKNKKNKYKLQKDTNLYPLVIINPQLVSLRLSLFTIHSSSSFSTPDSETFFKMYRDLLIMDNQEICETQKENAKQIVSQILQNRQNEFIKDYIFFLSEYSQYLDLKFPSNQRGKVKQEINDKRIRQILTEGLKTVKLVTMASQNTDGVTLNLTIYCNISSLLLRNLHNFQNKVQKERINQLIEICLCVVIFHELTHYLIHRLGLRKQDEAQFVNEIDNKDVPENGQKTRRLPSLQNSFSQNCRILQKNWIPKQRINMQDQNFCCFDRQSSNFLANFQSHRQSRNDLQLNRGSKIKRGQQPIL